MCFQEHLKENVKENLKALALNQTFKQLILIRRYLVKTNGCLTSPGHQGHRAISDIVEAQFPGLLGPGHKLVQRGNNRIDPKLSWLTLLAPHPCHQCEEEKG